jgi:phosphate transport system permease protein
MTEQGRDPRRRWATEKMRERLRRRHAAERRFRRLGLLAIALAGVALLVLLASIARNGVSAFQRTEVLLDVQYDAALIGEVGGLSGVAFERAAAGGDYGALVRQALREIFPDVTERRQLRRLQALVSSGARSTLRARLVADPSLLGQSQRVWLPADDEVDMLLKGRGGRERLEQGRLQRTFNTAFLSSGDSREPELAGIWGALMGTLLTLLVTLLISFPLGVASAVYLEEFAPRTRWTHLIEVNINNLAAVPSIVFGLLGLAVFLNLMHLPRSAPLVGGLTLALMTLPRAAPGDAGNPHRYDHRDGAGAGRDGPAPDDRDGGLRRGHPGGLHRCGDRAPGADLSVGGQPGAGLRGEGVRGDPRAVGLPDRYEWRGDLAAAEVREAMVRT